LAKVLITGGAGFIGSNAVERFCNLGHEVSVLDNLSRPGAARNLVWLQANLSFEFFEVEMRDADSVADVVAKVRPDYVIHCAGQVAVTTSVQNPRLDFEANILATFNLLEALRRLKTSPFLIFTSTNKVYGELEEIETTELEFRHNFTNLDNGVPESFPLDFRSPYGCSKGAADQYVLDYSRTFRIEAVVFRQSCVYGPRQFGVEDQGWIAWFMIASCLAEEVTIFGDGKQVRDALYVDDLIDVFEAAIKNRKMVSGRAYNIGGGPQNTLSLLELVEKIAALSGRPLNASFGPWRPSDQKVFISDIRNAANDIGWVPKTSVDAGLGSLHGWIVENISMIKDQVRGTH
jgi:CDP-paratose 2-epimerase